MRYGSTRIAAGRRRRWESRQAAALARLHTIATSLGALYPLLKWTVVEEESWCVIGRRLHIDPRTARNWAAASLSALAAL